MTPPEYDRRGARIQAGLDEFVGRKPELDQLERLLAGDRFAWVCGPPGVGKTRLSLEVARRREVAWFVDAHGVCSEAALLSELARSIGAARASTTDELARIIDRRGGALVVLDNVDDVAESAAKIGLELAEAGISVVCTARLHRAGALALGGLGSDEAVRLMEVRAGRVLDAGARQLAELLDGLPLAVELASRQLDIMSATALAERLTDGFAPATLQAAIRESWERFETAERETLQAACTFGFAFELNALEGVCGRPAAAELRTLVKHSVLSRFVAEGGEIRFRVLDAVKSFVRRHTDLPSLERRHAEYHAAVAHAAWGSQHGPGVAASIDRLVELQRELEVAMEHAIAHELQPAVDRLILGFSFLYYYLDTRQRTFAWVERAGELTGSSEFAADVWYELAHAKIDMIQPDEAEVFIEKLEVESKSQLQVAIVRRTRSRQCHYQGDTARGFELAQEALELARESADPVELISSMRNWAGIAYTLPDHHADALVMLRDAAREAAKLGALHHQAMSLYLLGYALAETAQVVAERDAVERALELFERAHNPGLALECRWMLGALEGALGRHDDARKLLDRVRDEALAAGMLSMARAAAEVAFSVEIDRGETSAAADDIEFQQEMLVLEPEDFGDHWLQVQKGRLLAHQGDLEAAKSTLELALATEGRHWNLGLMIWPRGVLQVIHGRLGNLDAAARIASDVEELIAEFDNEMWQTFAGLASAAMEYFAAGDELVFATYCAELGQTRVYASSAEVRSLARLSGGLDWAESGEVASLEDALLFSPDCSRFRPPGDEDWIDIGNRKRLVSIASQLVRAAEEERGPLKPEDLIATTWSDEVLTHESGLNRLRASVSMLRREGLGELVVFDNGGYRFAPGVDIVRIEE